MISSAPTSSPTSAFNPFLYATVGDDKNGMALTVLSVFARQDVDTWQEAADWSRLSGETAIQRITSRLETIPGDPSLIDRAAIAQRLLALLPRPRAVAGPPGRIFGRLPAGIKSIGSSGLSVVLIYLALMVVGEWIFAASVGPSAPAQAQATQQAPVR